MVRAPGYSSLYRCWLVETTKVGFPVVMIDEADERLPRLRVYRSPVGGMRDLHLRFEIEKIPE